jgi:two-component system chemotaxis response regulator CheB
MLDYVLSRLEPLPAAIVITQHMPPGFTSSLAERLNRISRVPVKESENGDTLENEKAYVSCGGFHTVLAGIMTKDGRNGGKIIHSSAPPVHAVRPAVDITFASGARAFGRMVFSVLLSGMGNDGGEGTAEVKRAGGMTAVCDERDCLVYGMARAALGTQKVDQIIPLDAMAGAIRDRIFSLGDCYV